MAEVEQRTLKDGHAVAVMRDSKPFAMDVVLAAVKQGKKIPPPRSLGLEIRLVSFILPYGQTATL